MTMVSLALLGGTAPDILAQAPATISKEVLVSGSGGSLALEFRDGTGLRIALEGEDVVIDGVQVGSFQPGGPLEAAWRSLLADAVAADESGMRGILLEWEPAGELSGSDLAAAGQIRQALDEALSTPTAAPTASRLPEGIPLSWDTASMHAMEALLRQAEFLRGLAAVAGEMSFDQIEFRSGETEISEDEVLDGTLLVVDGRIRLDGEVTGDVILLGGSVELGEEARVGGELRWIEADISGPRDGVLGGIREIEPEALQRETRQEVRSEATSATRTERRTSTERNGLGRLASNIGAAIGSILQVIVAFGVLLGLGLALLYFSPRNFEVVARTARAAPGRSAVVGLAGGFLTFPVWVMGIVLLTVTIIGIPVMLVWLPLFPMAAALAAAAGYVAVARNVGSWVAHRDDSNLGREDFPFGLGRFDRERPAARLGVGLVLLLIGFALAGVLHFGGDWFAFLRWAATAVAILVTVAAVTVGFGAVLLSRAGRDPRYARGGWNLDEPEAAGASPGGHSDA
ncbi:MAG: hypothetical protein WD960_05295 [Gemmatimonadota bacterium]